MSRIGKLLKGLDEERVVELELPGPRGARETIRLGVRALPAWDETDVRAAALAFAKAKGAPAEDDDPIYVMGVWVNTILNAYVSLDAEDKGNPAFDNVEEILHGLDRDRIAYLFEQQQLMQEESGARKETLSEEETIAAVMQIARAEVGARDLPFWHWGQTALASYMRFTARLLLASDAFASLSSSGSAPKDDVSLTKQ